MEHFNLVQFVGLSGAPTIQQAVQYLRDQWKLPTYLAPFTAVLFGMLMNVGLAWYLHSDLTQGVLVGALTGLFASGWHEIQKK